MTEKKTVFLTKKRVLVDFGQKNWSILAETPGFRLKNTVLGDCDQKSGFGRLWPEKLVLGDFDWKKLIFVNVGRKL